jgi:hypothetical protein
MIIHWLTTTIIPVGVSGILLCCADKLEREPRRQRLARKAGLGILGVTAFLHLCDMVL